MPDQKMTVDILEKELARLLSWIQTIESKISIIFPLSTAMLGSLAVLVPKYACWTAFPTIVSVISILFLIFSIVFSALASFPRTSGPEESLIYFGRIASMDLDQYETAVKQLGQDGYIDDLIKQCHRNAQIAKRKFSWVKRALACLFISSAPWVIAVYLLYSNQAHS